VTAARRSIGAAVALLLVAALVVLARADYFPPCAPPQHVVLVPLKQVPRALMEALRENLGEIVAPGEIFDATDVVLTGRNRRFIFFWRDGKKWIVATEHGGFAYNNPIFLYHLGESERKAVLTAQKIAFPKTVCAVASELQISP
jgi:hypothetical protein